MQGRLEPRELEREGMQDRLEPRKLVSKPLDSWMRIKNALPLPLFYRLNIIEVMYNIV